MAVNTLEPGYAGLPAPSPKDQEANALGSSLPKSEPSEMMQGFQTSLQSSAAKFKKLQELDNQLSATRKQVDHLVALGDTVTTEDVIDAASEMVAAGMGAVEVASILADMPDSGEALQKWVAEQDQKVAGLEAQVGELLAGARFKMGTDALQTIIGASIEDHEQKRALARAPLGRMH